MAQKLCSPCMPVSALQLGTRTSSELLLRNFCFSGGRETYFEEDKIFRVKPKAHQLVELAGPR